VAVTDPVEPSRLRRWALPLVFGIAVVVLGGVSLILRAAGSTAAPAGGGGPPAHPQHLFACAVPADAPNFCQYLAHEMARRTQLSGADYQQAARAELDVSQVVHSAQPVRGQQCLTNTPLKPGAPCRVVPDSGAPTDPRPVEQALLAAGYRGAVVRLATSSDPIPRGALLYGVPVGNACILGYNGGQGVVGMLPDHSCLSP
jgi:hypothetical protein